MNYLRIALQTILSLALLISCGSNTENSSITNDMGYFLQEIQTTVEAKRMELIEIRRDFHMHPELSGNEVRTAKVVAQHLKSLGLEVRTNIGGHGVVGVLHGALKGPVVAYRADMDAFPSPVIGDQSYRSQNPGIGHVCGHDVHTTIAIGIATVLSSVKGNLPGTVVFIFQPAEEAITGAKAMIADSALISPRPNAIFALHTAPTSVGTIMINNGSGLSGFRNFEIEWSSGDNDERAAIRIMEALKDLNTVQSAAEVVTNPDLMKALVQDFMIEDGPLTRFKNVQYVHNKDMSKVNVWTRSPTMKQLDEIEEEIKDLIEKSNQAGSNYVLTKTGELPTMQQDQFLVEQAYRPIEAIVGTENTLMSYGAFPYNGEDFSYFLKEVPGAMFFLGVANEEKGISGINHLPNYDVDEESIIVGTKAMSNVLINFLIESPIEN